MWTLTVSVLPGQLFQLVEMMAFSLTLEEEAAPQLVQRLSHHIRRELLPPRVLRVNRREIKQIYNKYKPKKRDVPPPEPFEPEDRFLDFVEILDPLAPKIPQEGLSEMYWPHGLHTQLLPPIGESTGSRQADVRIRPDIAQSLRHFLQDMGIDKLGSSPMAMITQITVTILSSRSRSSQASQVLSTSLIRETGRI